jgi:hypothetical protein
MILDRLNGLIFQRYARLSQKKRTSWVNRLFTSRMEWRVVRPLTPKLCIASSLKAKLCLWQLLHDILLFTDKALS